MIGMKVEDRVDGTSNFSSWKSRVLILEENDILKFVNEDFQNQKRKSIRLSGKRVMLGLGESR